MYKYEITIAVAIYNVEKYLEKCLNSLLNQTEKNGYEILLINDGSTDSSREICEKYIKNGLKAKLINQSNKGLIGVRNLSIKLAEGRYILFLDGDDYVDINMLSVLFKEINNVDYDMIAFGFNWIENNKINLDNRFLKERTINDKIKINELVFSKEINTSVWNKIFKMSIIKENKISFENFFKCEDILFVIRFLEHSNEVKFIKLPLYYYIFRDNSLSNVKNKDYYINYLNLYSNIIDNFKNKYLYNYIVFEFVYLVREYLKSNIKNREIIEKISNIQRKIGIKKVLTDEYLNRKVKIRYFKIFFKIEKIKIFKE